MAKKMIEKKDSKKHEKEEHDVKGLKNKISKVKSHVKEDIKTFSKEKKDDKKLLKIINKKK